VTVLRQFSCRTEAYAAAQQIDGPAVRSSVFLLHNTQSVGWDACDAGSFSDATGECGADRGALQASGVARAVERDVVSGTDRDGDWPSARAGVSPSDRAASPPAPMVVQPTVLSECPLSANGAGQRQLRLFARGDSRGREYGLPGRSPLLLTLGIRTDRVGNRRCGSPGQLRTASMAESSSLSRGLVPPRM
jgi:hypothetical protein